MIATVVYLNMGLDLILLYFQNSRVLKLFFSVFFAFICSQMKFEAIIVCVLVFFMQYFCLAVLTFRVTVPDFLFAQSKFFSFTTVIS